MKMSAVTAGSSGRKVKPLRGLCPRLQLGDYVGDECHGGRLAAADAHLAGEHVGGHEELRLGAAHQIDDLLRTAPQAHACLGKLDVTAAAVEELAAQLALKIVHL